MSFSSKERALRLASGGRVVVDVAALSVDATVRWDLDLKRLGFIDDGDGGCWGCGGASDDWDEECEECEVNDCMTVGGEKDCDGVRCGDWDEAEEKEDEEPNQRSSEESSLPSREEVLCVVDDRRKLSVGDELADSDRLRTRGDVGCGRLNECCAYCVCCVFCTCCVRCECVWCGCGWESCPSPTEWRCIRWAKQKINSFVFFSWGI